MENMNDMAMIPYFAHEGIIDRFDRVNRRLLIALIVAIALIVLSNAAWLYCWMQYDYVGEETEVVTTVDSEGGGIANYTGNDGGVTIGESYGQEDNANAQPNAPVW